ncbi:hypothetical protein AAVH_25354 [Aphelenchoides avenae]|nr:hypothetical protein AAVH_25354 [Aphelenchus avenae]
MTKRRLSLLQPQDEESTRELIRALREDLIGTPKKYTPKRRVSTDHASVGDHFEGTSGVNSQPTRPVITTTSTAASDNHTLRVIKDVAEVLVEVLSWCDAITQAYIRYTTRVLSTFLDAHVPSVGIRLEFASIGLRFKQQPTDEAKLQVFKIEDPHPFEGLEAEYITQLMLAGCTVQVSYSNDSFDEVVALLSARIRSTYVERFTVSSQCLSWDSADLPKFLADSNSGSDTVIGKLHLLSEDRVPLGHIDNTVHEIAIDEWTGVHGDFEPENTEFGELFLKRCLDAGIRQANLRKLSFDVEGAPYFCLANSAAEHAGECRLAICGAIYNGDDFEKLILRICKLTKN